MVILILILSQGCAGFRQTEFHLCGGAGIDTRGRKVGGHVRRSKRGVEGLEIGDFQKRGKKGVGLYRISLSLLTCLILRIPKSFFRLA